jgi:hypothetical protein
VGASGGGVNGGGGGGGGVESEGGFGGSFIGSRSGGGSRSCQAGRKASRPAPKTTRVARTVYDAVASKPQGAAVCNRRFDLGRRLKIAAPWSYRAGARGGVVVGFAVARLRRLNRSLSVESTIVDSFVNAFR